MAEPIENPDDMPVVECPKCGQQQVDYDGFGVIYCQSCGHCVHPSAHDGICDVCHRPIYPDHDDQRPFMMDST